MDRVTNDIQMDDESAIRNIDNYSEKKQKGSCNINQIVSGLSIMSADYNLFIINMVLVILIAVSPDKVLYLAKF